MTETQTTEAVQRMDPEVKRLWVEALESGEFKQATGMLRRDEDGTRYCCLGVLCELHRRLSSDPFEWENCGNGKSYGGGLILPPEEVSEWAEAPIGYCEVGLLNDKGESFSAIAAYIQEKF